MKRMALAAVALVSVTAFTGASAAPAAAPAAAAPVVHTLKWKLNATASHNVSKYHFVGTDRIKSVRTGEVIGFDSTTGRFFPKTNSARIQVAASVRGGILVGRVHGTFDSKIVVFRGRILKGTGKFVGAEGRIVARSSGGGRRTLVTIRYS